MTRREQDYTNSPVAPGSGGLNDQTNPVLLGDEEASALSNVDFDQKSIRGSLGWKKLHRELPMLAGLRFQSRPRPAAAAGLDHNTVPWGAIPYHELQDQSTGLQLDFSFRLNSDIGTLTNLDQNGERFDAPVGGEMQYHPMVSRGGDDVQELLWSAGVVVGGAEGLGTNPARVDKILRLIFLWWDESATSMKYSVPNIVILPGQEYHVTVSIHANDDTQSQWYVNGTAVSVLDAALRLPDVAEVQANDGKYSLYLNRPFTRGQGVYAHAPLMRGLYGATTTAVGTTTTLISTELQLAGAKPTVNDSWAGYYVRCLTGANAGSIRRVEFHGGPGYTEATGTLSFATDPWGSAWGSGDTFDIFPAVEPCSQDVTLQEMRLWSLQQSASVVARLVGKQALQSLEGEQSVENYAEAVGADLTTLVGYWPLSDDGGTMLADRGPAKNHGWLSSSPYQPDGGVTLDGQRTAVQQDITDIRRLHPQFEWNLGRDGRYRIHARARFRICRDLFDTDPGGAGAIDSTPWETIFCWGGEGSASTLELRWTHYAGGRRFYFAFNNGRDSEFITVGSATTGQAVTPYVGREYTVAFGIAQDNLAGGALTNNHRLYLLLLDGSDQPKGWSGTTTLTLASPIPLESSRISWGSSVNGDPTKGNGDHNHMLTVVREAGWALRPYRFTGPGTSSPSVDNWTSTDDSVEVESRISERSPVVDLTRGSTAMPATSGEEWTTWTGSPPPAYFPNPGHLLRVQGFQEDRKQGEAPKQKPRYIHVEAFVSTPAGNAEGTLSEPWQGETLLGTEVRIPSYLCHTYFQGPERELTLNAAPEAGSAWAVTEDAYADRGSLSQFDPEAWGLALIPTVPGNAQELYRAFWDSGLVTGFEPVRGLAQLKQTSGERHLLAAVNGSLYRVDPRWVQDHPRLGQVDSSGTEYKWSLEFRNVTPRVARHLEEAQEEGYRKSRITQPLYNERVECADGTGGGKLWIPNDSTGLPDPSYVEIRAWVKLDRTDGIRTIASRIVNKSDGFDLYRQINSWFYLQGGAPVLELRDEELGRYYKVSAASAAADEKVKARELVRAGEWTLVSAVLQIDWAGDQFVDAGAMFGINGVYHTDVYVDASGTRLAPSTLPDNTDHANWGVYGSSYQSGAFYPVVWDYGLGGRSVDLEMRVNDVAYNTVVIP